MDDDDRIGRLESQVDDLDRQVAALKAVNDERARQEEFREHEAAEVKAAKTIPRPSWTAILSVIISALALLAALHVLR